MLMMNCEGSTARVLLLCSEATNNVPLAAAYQATLNSANATVHPLLEAENDRMKPNGDTVSLNLSTSHYALKTVHCVFVTTFIMFQLADREHFISYGLLYCYIVVALSDEAGFLAIA